MTSPTFPSTLSRRAALQQAVAFGAACTLPLTAQAQANWPQRGVRIVVPFTPGTGIDILARTLQPRLQEAWGQSVTVENRAGASGNIGAESVARATDGHTLLMGVNTLVINPALFANLRYDVLRDFAPLGVQATGTFLLVVHPKLNVRSVADYVALARLHPGQQNYASPGVATPHHMAFELFKKEAGIFVTHIPFTGTAGAVTQLVAGEVPAMFLPVHVAMVHVRAGRLVPLAVASTQRSPQAPDVPTLAEQGVRNVQADLWYGLLAPASTGTDVVQRIHGDTSRILALPEVRAALATQGLQVQNPASRESTPAGMAQLMREDAARWAALVRSQQIKAE